MHVEHKPYYIIAYSSLGICCMYMQLAAQRCAMRTHLILRFDGFVIQACCEAPCFILCSNSLSYVDHVNIFHPR